MSSDQLKSGMLLYPYLSTIDEMMVDERKASIEYEQFGLSEIAKDESEHYEELKEIRKTKKCKRPPP